MSKDNLRLFASSVETFRDDGTPESKTEYNRGGDIVRITTYDEHGHPLAYAMHMTIARLGIC